MTEPAHENDLEHDDGVLTFPVLGDWVSTEASIDPATGERADVFETVRPATPVESQEP